MEKQIQLKREERNLIPMGQVFARKERLNEDKIKAKHFFKNS